MTDLKIIQSPEVNSNNGAPAVQPADGKMAGHKVSNWQKFVNKCCTKDVGLKILAGLAAIGTAAGVAGLVSLYVLFPVPMLTITGIAAVCGLISLIPDKKTRGDALTGCLALVLLGFVAAFGSPFQVNNPPPISPKFY